MLVSQIMSIGFNLFINVSHGPYWEKGELWFVFILFLFFYFSLLFHVNLIYMQMFLSWEVKRVLKHLLLHIFYDVLIY